MARLSGDDLAGVETREFCSEGSTGKCSNNGDFTSMAIGKPVQETTITLHRLKKVEYGLGSATAGRRVVDCGNVQNLDNDDS